MSREKWDSHIEELGGYLRAVAFTDAAGTERPADEAFTRWHDLAVCVREQKKTIHLIGNGASASMASHFAADIAKNAGIRTNVFSDLSLITALANDMSYELVFAEPLRQHACEGDMLVAISSSGRSPNILEAVRVAVERGLLVITLSGMSPGNPLRSTGCLNFFVPAVTYGYVETCHAALLHHWMDTIELK